MKPQITRRELSILVGVVVALIVMIVLWINPLGGGFSIIPSLSINDIAHHFEPPNLKTIFHFKGF
jgi:hypothetical protein